VGAASDVLGVPASDLLELVGRYWVSYTRQHGYKSLFDIGYALVSLLFTAVQCDLTFIMCAHSGASLPEFLSNLNAIHTHIQAQFPKLRMPTFWCTDLTPSSLTLHYRPGRPSRNGLAPLVMGLMKGLADLFNLEDFEIEHTGKRSNDGAGDGVDFDVFALRWDADTSTDSSVNTPSLMFDSTATYDLTASAASTAVGTDDDLSCGSSAYRTKDKMQAFEARWQFCLPPTRFAAAFPFHLVLSQDLKIMQTGEVLQRLCPEMTVGSDFSQHWRVVRPELAAAGRPRADSAIGDGSENKSSGGVTFQMIKDNRDALFLLESVHNKRLKLRGQMNVIASTEGCQVANSGGTLRRARVQQPHQQRPQREQTTQAPIPARETLNKARSQRQMPATPSSPSATSPRCPMSSQAASKHRSTTYPTCPVSFSLADMEPLASAGASKCPMPPLASASSSVVNIRRKKKPRSLSDPTKDDGIKKKNKKRAPRPEEDDMSDLNDSNPSVICAPASLANKTSEPQVVNSSGNDSAKTSGQQQQERPKAKKNKTSRRARARSNTREHGVALEEYVFFLGSVQVKDNEEVVELGLSLHDFALHDAVKEVLLISASNETTMRDVHQMEEFILYGMDGNGDGSTIGGRAGKSETAPYDNATSGSGRRPSKHNAHAANNKYTSKCILS
jgi:hypothetical protein